MTRTTGKTMGRSILHSLLPDALSLEPGRLKYGRLQSLSPHQWEGLIVVAEEQHVTPLLYARLRDKGMETAVPPHIRQKLRHRYQGNTVRNLSIYGELRRLAAALQAQNIPFIALKGAFLADTVYGSMGERIVGDLDLLVPKEAMSQVITISETLDYRKTKPIVLDVWLEKRHHIPAFMNRKVRLAIEWHWHIVRPDTYFAIPVAGLWQRAIPATVAGIPVLTLSPEDLVLHIADHISYHHEFTFGVRSLCDLGSICAFYKEAIDWDVVGERAKKWCRQRGIYLALRLAQERFGATVPQSVMKALRPVDFTKGLVETAVTQAFINPAEFQQVPTAFRHFQRAQGVVNKGHIIRDSLFPSPERMAIRYGIVPGSMPWLQRHLFRWQDLIRQTFQNLRRLPQSKESLLPAIQRKNDLSAWMARKV